MPTVRVSHQRTHGHTREHPERFIEILDSHTERVPVPFVVLSGDWEVCACVCVCLYVDASLPTCACVFVYVGVWVLVVRVYACLRVYVCVDPCVRVRVRWH